MTRTSFQRLLRDKAGKAVFLALLTTAWREVEGVAFPVRLDQVRLCHQGGLLGVGDSGVCGASRFTRALCLGLLQDDGGRPRQ